MVKGKRRRVDRLRSTIRKGQKMEEGRRKSKVGQPRATRVIKEVKVSECYPTTVTLHSNAEIIRINTIFLMSNEKRNIYRNFNSVPRKITQQAVRV